uniref:Uncharacterized protein n=1 Tax=Strombidinopsis acuminata TaxID=141414 RepID=A0A7S3T4F0_9SPIT
MADLLKKFAELEVFCNGCRNECDQKCVIDNHEVEILQGPIFEIPNCGNLGDIAFCPSGQISQRGASMDLCTPSQRANYYGDGALTRALSNTFRTRSCSAHGPGQFPSGIESDRSRSGSSSNVGIFAGAGSGLGSLVRS